jgi:acetyl-CoA acetyltransferase
VGVATTAIGAAPGLDPLEMISDAAYAALDDAGLSMLEVDGLFGCMQTDFFSTMSIAEYLGVRPTVSDNNRIGGASFLAHTMQAALALEAGLCEVALICYGSNQRSALGRLQTAVSNAWSPFETRYDPMFPASSYALAASRHMHEFGTTREQLASVAVAARGWANLNPEAFARGPLSIDDVLRSRMVSSPLSRLDCCLVTDGAGAVVMVRRERARDCRKNGIYLLGAGMAHSHKHISEMPDLCVTAAVESGRRAYDMARLSAAEVDMVQLYDAFTINTILFLEDLGFCPKGEGGSFVEGGRIAPGGALPVNTNGGGLSYAHPGMYGIFTLIEGVRQLRGEGDMRQVQDPAICLCHGSGGVLSTQVTNILGTRAAL